MTRRPTLPETALHGLPGEAVRYIDPHTEAARPAVLLTFLAAAGNYIGAKPHMFAGDTFHPARLWPLIVGPSSNGMKGTSWNVVSRVLETADTTYAITNTSSGLSSAEGLIELVRDPNGPDPGADGFDEGVLDKRRIIIETEFAAVLGRSRREGNTLSATLRDTWDGKRLQTLTRKVNALISSGHHVTVIGHISPEELISKLSSSDMAGGLINRFLPCYSIRSKRLPDGGGIPDDVLAYLGGSLRAVRDKVRNTGRMHRTADARELWHSYYDELTPDELAEGPVAWVSARAVPQVIRLSTTYALLDGRHEIDVPHLLAALAVWNYVKATVEFTFGGAIGNPDLGRLMEYVDAGGIEGVSRTAIAKDLFRNHKTRAELDRLIELLLDMDEYEADQIPTPGRPRKILRRKPPEVGSGVPKLWEAS